MMGGEGSACLKADILEIPESAGEAGWREVPGTSTVTKRKMVSMRKKAASSGSKSGFPRSELSNSRCNSMNQGKCDKRGISTLCFVAINKTFDLAFDQLCFTVPYITCGNNAGGLLVSS